ncbi:MAG TPA: hypothetical protein VF042_07105 [Gemmatimonadaceae bacterium]
MSAFGRLIPFLTVIVIVFSLLQLYTAIVSMVNKEYVVAAINIVFSFAGVALARALWTNRARFR